jgi:pilus assembly protein CpaF
MASSRLDNLEAGGPGPEKTEVGTSVRANGESSGSVVKDDGQSSDGDWLFSMLLSASCSGRLERLSEGELRLELGRIASELSRQKSDSLSSRDREILVEQVLDEVFGYGPFRALVRDHDISDIAINGPHQVYVEKRGQLQTSDVAFRDEEHLLQVIRRLIATSGRRIDAKTPMVDARLPDGSRLNAVNKPPALNGPLVSIRRFGARPLTAADLVANKSIAQEMLDFLAACVKARTSMIISGGTGSGKTTLLNTLSRFIPATERLVTIEDTAELELQQPHVAKMQALLADWEGNGEVTMRDLVKNSLRMRPDRIIVGECRGAEAFEMLQAMNTGHDGSLTTIHANSTREALSRLELIIGLGGIDIPVWAIRELVANSITLVIQASRLADGKRKIVTISEITGMEGNTISMHDIFKFNQTGVDRNQVVQGHFSATGIRPKLLTKLEVRGARLPVEMFRESRL